MGQHDTTADSGVSLTRRRLLGGAGAIAGGSALALIATREADAQVELGSWSVQGTETTVDAPPQAIRVAASGRFDVSRRTTPEMTEVTLQVGVDGAVDDLDTQAFYDTDAGEFAFSGVDLFAHRDIARGDLTPEEAGQTATIPITVRLVVTVIDSGNVVIEDSVEATDDLILTRSGVAVAIGGSASLTVEE